MNIYTEYYTYLYYDIDETPIYVGKGQNKAAFRHIRLKTHLGNLLRKRREYGIDITPLITYHQNELTALAMEIFWIAVYGRKDLNRGTLFNNTNGGEGASGIKRKPFTDEHRRKISESGKGRTSPNKGKPMSDERKLQHSLVMKGKPAWNKGLDCTNESVMNGVLAAANATRGKPWSAARRSAQLLRQK